MPGTVVLLPLEDQPWHKPGWPQGLAPSLQAVPTLWHLAAAGGARGNKGLGPSCQFSQVPEASQSYQRGDGWIQDEEVQPNILWCQPQQLTVCFLENSEMDWK